MAKPFPALLLTLLAFTAAASVNAKQADAVFAGTVLHSSTHSIKVKNPRSGEVLEFQIIPRLTRLEGHLKSHTMSAVRPGDFVKVYYDQHFLGLRHADRIIDSQHPGKLLKG